MDDVSSNGHAAIKTWRGMAALQGKARTFRVAEVSKACMSEDLKHRVAVQNKLADVCVDMCKELGAYPEKCTCPGYTDTTDKTLGVMTWDEVLKYMDDVSSNGHAAIKTWRGMAALQRKARTVRVAEVSKACMSEDLKHRVAVQNKLHDVCVDMCKELGAYPKKCTCPGYTDTTDKTPGVMTWDELLTYMDDVSSNGHAALKDWTAAAR